MTEEKTLIKWRFTIGVSVEVAYQKEIKKFKVD